LLLGVITPDNTPHGANLTFLLPEIGFIVIAAALFLRFRRQHKVPGHARLALPPPHPAPAASRSGSALPAEQAALATSATDQAAAGQPEQAAAAGQPEQAAAGDPEDGP
jgi:hypothetical protein